MRVAQTADQLHEALEQAGREAATAFGAPEIFLEKFVSRARHLEVQLLGDAPRSAQAQEPSEVEKPPAHAAEGEVSMPVTWTNWQRALAGQQRQALVCVAVDDRPAGGQHGLTCTQVVPVRIARRVRQYIRRLFRETLKAQLAEADAAAVKEQRRGAKKPARKRKGK